MDMDVQQDFLSWREPPGTSGGAIRAAWGCRRNVGVGVGVVHSSRTWSVCVLPDRWLTFFGESPYVINSTAVIG